MPDEAKPHSPVDPDAVKAPLASEALERERDADGGTAEDAEAHGDQQAAVERGLTRIPPG